MEQIIRHKPIAEQIHSILLERIINREFDEAGRLPSEEQLAVEMNVSRSTVRTALTMLAAEGYLYRKHGSGTYVNSKVIEIKTRLDGIWEFSKLIESSGRKPSIKVLAEKVRCANKSEEEQLMLRRDEKVLSLERLFFADEHPVICSTNVLPEKIIINPYPKEALIGPINKFLELYCGFQIDYTIADISATLVSEIMSKLLNVSIGEPLLKFEEIFYGSHNVPLVKATNLYYDKLLRLRVFRA